MYRFASPRPLSDELIAHGSGNELFFGTSKETARVVLADRNIAEVMHTDLVTGKTRSIPAAEAKHIVVGRDNFARDVYHYLLPNPEPHLQLRLGITIHRGEGSWSSLPHPFELRPEKGFEEVFFYLLSGGSARAIQVGVGVWADGTPVDACWPVADHSFGTIPMGYHPVVGEPMVAVRYIWAYLVKKPAWEKI